MGPMPTRNLSLLPSVDQFLGGMLIGDLGRPLVLSIDVPLAASYGGISCMSGGEVGSPGCSDTEVFAGTEEADPGRPPRPSVLTRTPRSWTKACSTTHSSVKFLIAREAEKILFSYPTKMNSSSVRRPVALKRRTTDDAQAMDDCC
ncbi:hypothetical protein BHM03_00058694, partial [Ensete ventricosum]